MTSFCQDRLGTNIGGKAEKKRRRGVFLQTVMPTITTPIDELDTKTMRHAYYAAVVRDSQRPNRSFFP
jgi:hypothetical protein